jgi:hypothetical protein
LIHDAREKTQELLEAAKKAGNILAGMLLDDEDDKFPLKNRVDKRDEVLVRLKVEHSGFSTLNNQRFGAKFIGEVANPVSNKNRHNLSVILSSFVVLTRLFLSFSPPYHSCHYL